MFTEKHYEHLKETGFNPGICSECKEIDAVLMDLPGSSRALYAALKAMNDGSFLDPENSNRVWERAVPSERDNTERPVHQRGAKPL